MKVKFNENKVPDIKFPWIGNNKFGVVVLFYDKNAGIALSETDYYRVGDHTTTWNMEDFYPFEGEVILSN